MFPVASPPPVASAVRSEDAALNLRLNQRLTAEVLQIAADHVVLAVDGVPVVARLTAAEQMAALADRRAAQFVVRGFADQAVVLQLVGHGAATPTPSAAPPPDLLAGLLQEAGLPGDAATLRLAQALLDRGLPVTAAAVAELAEGLNGLPGWTAADAQRAAGLKAAGLPVSAGALSLLASAPVQLSEPLARLQAQLESLAGQAGAAPLAPLLRDALAVLARLRLDWSAPPDSIAEQLRSLVEVLGQPLERQLAQASTPPATEGLMTLARLRAELAQAAARNPALATAVQSLDQFLDAARLAQFRNIAPNPVPGEGHWFRLDLPAVARDDPAAHLRIAYRPGQDTDIIDARHTRLVLQLEMGEGETLEVDLSVAERQIGAWITATDEAWRDGAEAELAALEAGLGQLGYELKSARCRVGRPAPAGPGGVASGGRTRHVNVEA